MARPPGVKGGRPIVVGVRLSEAEAADLDKMRGSLNRAEWVRWLVLKARKEANLR